MTTTERTPVKVSGLFPLRNCHEDGGHRASSIIPAVRPARIKD
jgi:hypothetical protein